MARRMVPLVPEEADLFVPVPLHRWRLWARGFNQSVAIAAALARLSGRAVDSSVLVRTRSTPSLRGLGHDARARAVRGVFAVTERARVAGRRVVLVDDVYTSGATADAATRALLRAGAASVTVLCWARVLGESDD